MKLMYLNMLLVLIASVFSACKNSTIHKDRVIVVQPFDDFTLSLSEKVSHQLKQIHPEVVLRKEIALPASAYYKERNRYRADSLISYLKQYASPDTVVIGLTTKDISTTKGNVKDWGVMGLAYCPGYTCVVSVFRLKKENLYEQFYKVAIHELGHTQGLKHCPHKTCFMRDAEGGNPLNEEHEFCTSCKKYLIKKGWKLN